MERDNNTILEIRDLSLFFNRYGRGLRRTKLQVINNLNLSIQKGEILAVIGSSGSGKSLLAHSIMGILPTNGMLTGSINYKDDALTEKRLKKLRGSEIAFVPQSLSYLDPLMKVGKQIARTEQEQGLRKEVFQRYALDERVADCYPNELSGGMARRVLISTAVTLKPELIIADEPTPGLDSELAMETVRNFRNLADEGCSILLITHDIDLALSAADRVAVFYAGTVLEVAPAEDFLKGPDRLRHPYSKALWYAMPQNGFYAAAGTQPYAGDMIDGCVYGSRCKEKTERCKNKIKMRVVRGGEVCCLNAT